MSITITEAAPIDLARGVLERAESLAWPDEARPAIARAASDLRDAIDIHEMLRDRRLSWECYDTDLATWPEPHNAAVDQSAKDAEEYAWMLAEVIEKHMGRETAEYVSTGETA